MTSRWTFMAFKLRKVHIYVCSAPCNHTIYYTVCNTVYRSVPSLYKFMNTILSCIRIAMDLPDIVHIIYYRSKTVCYQCQSTYTCNLINAISSKTEDHTIKQASKT